MCHLYSVYQDERRCGIVADGGGPAYIHFCGGIRIAIGVIDIQVRDNALQSLAQICNWSILQYFGGYLRYGSC